MEKRKWLWKRKPSERSPGETESSGSLSSLSEKYSDDQDVSKALPSDSTQSPEVTSKATATGDDIDGGVKILTEKLSAALLNVRAKEDLVKQHAKVAEEAIAGWEKAEDEVTSLKQLLEAAMQKNSALEDRGNHLDSALKECVRQLRQVREDQEQKIAEAVSERTREWESTKVGLIAQLERLKGETTGSSPPVDPDLLLKIKFLESENSALKLELLSRSDELEILAIERDLSTQAAENASRQHLEGIKKVAKLEAECRRLNAVMNRKSSLFHDQKSVSTSSIYVESLTDSQSDSGERTTLISELDQPKSEKSLRAISGTPFEIDFMDDFLEMERLVTLPEQETKGKNQKPEIKNEENQLKADYESMSHRVFELEEKIKKIELEKHELEKALTDCRSSYEESQYELKRAETRLEDLQKELEGVNESKESIQIQLKGMGMRLEELQKELDGVNKSKELLESKLVKIGAEARTMSSKANSLEEQIEKDKRLSEEMAAKCRALEDELEKKSQEIELQQTVMANGKAEIQQEELDVAAGKLAECQKTIASLGRQLRSLATLEDFLADTANIPGFSKGTEFSELQSKVAFFSKNNSDQAMPPVENSSPIVNGNKDDTSPASSSSTSSSSLSLASSKSRNGFEKFFTRTKSRVQLETQER